jgi:hypothetical protein
MSLGLQDFTHEFFSGKGISTGSGTINWASAEGTPADYNSGTTEKVEMAIIKVKASFNSSDTDDITIHIRKLSATNLQSETRVIEAPGSTIPQEVEIVIPGLFSDLDLGIEHAGSSYSVTIDADIVDGTKITGVTAAA